MTDFSLISVLVVDANSGMRSQLRSMLAGFGVERVQFAVSASMAIRRLQDARFDVVLCEYNLGDGQDGQHLLEDLRHQEIIPLDTLFIMVTGERNYERVVSTAELVPNDYVLKPLAAFSLKERLEQTLAKRKVFMPAYRQLAQSNVVGAIAALRAAVERHPRYRTDLQRLLAEQHLSIGQLDEAETLYRKIDAAHHLPWAQLGIARTLVLKKQYVDAEALLTMLVEHHENFIAAYDLLAQCQLAEHRPEEALKTLEVATRRSPHRVKRMRKVGEVAISVGDNERATAVMAEVVRKGKYSDFRNPEDHVRLVQAQVGCGKVDEAQATIRDLERSMAGKDATSVCSALARAMVASGQGQAGAARAALLEGIQLSGEHLPISGSLQQELIKACFDNDLEAEGSALVLDLLRNSTDDETIDGMRAALKARGRESLAEHLEQSNREEVRQLVAAGAAKAKAGDFDGAVQEMMGAVRRMPGNTHVLFNAALALLRHVEHRGWNERFASQAGALIRRAHKADPTNPRLAAISAFMYELIEKQSPGASAQVDDQA